MKTIIEIAYDKHKEWIKIVKSFGCNPSQSDRDWETIKWL